MSTTPPASSSALHSPISSPHTVRTRTVAIIKTHALKHRFDIEPRIQEAGFEIVKERQMEFDTETDPEFMYELFGEDVHSLAEGPVWVYVLERRRAVEVLHALMGDRDPSIAQQSTPHSIRALYGLSLEQNAIMGSPDVRMAEFQISTLFASSPVFPVLDLPEDHIHGHPYTSSSAERKTSQAGSTVGSTKGHGRLSAAGKTIFRARAIPKTHVAPDIAPRTTKAAALRAGQLAVVVDKVTPTVPRAPPTKAALAKTFANVPGHKRTDTIQVASTAAPTIAPRMTKAASLRIANDANGANKAKKPRPSLPAPPSAPPASGVRRQSIDPAKTFANVPGHKRAESIAVASTAVPVLAPRSNRAAELRAAKDTAKDAPPSSFRASTTVRAPGLARTGSQSSSTPPERRNSRPASVASVRTADAEKEVSPAPSDPAVVAPKKPRPRPMSLQAPSIAPRPNKSATLRAANGANGQNGPAKASVRSVFI